MRRLTPFLAGFVLLASSLARAQETDRNSTVPAMDHSHMPIALPDEVPTPALSLRLSDDAVSGFNLELILERFSLEPPPPSGVSMAELMKPTIDSESGFAEGHAHLYVNGDKIQRLYGPNVHLPGTLFRSGINQIVVSLNDHAHRRWTRGGRAVLATLFVDPKRDGVEVHRFESYPVAPTSSPR
jgi:hypothetical protein